jgi:hypothetical protein
MNRIISATLIVMFLALAAMIPLKAEAVSADGKMSSTWAKVKQGDVSVLVKKSSATTTSQEAMIVKDSMAKLAPAAINQGVNGVLINSWWGYVIALDSSGTKKLITDLKNISAGATIATAGMAIAWPFAVPVAVYKIGLSAYIKVIELAAMKGTGIFIWVTRTGQAFCVLPLQ